MDEPNKTADMFTEQVSAPKLKPVMGFRDLVFFYIVAIFGVRLLPVAASAGPSIVTFFLISLLIFFIPMGLTVIDLSKRYPVDGALYVWSKKAFGDFHGYITAWTYWTANLAFFPSLLLFTSSHLFLILPGYEHLSQSPVALGLLSTVVVLMMLFINLVGMKVSTIFNNISGVATYIAVALILVIGIASWIKLGPATDLSFDNWIPSLGSIKDLVFLSTVVYMFAGLECASMLGDEVRDARKTIPRAIVTSGILITLMYIFASFSLLVAVPTETLNDLTGISDAVRTGVGQLGGASLSLVFGSLSSFLLVIMGLGGLSVCLPHFPHGDHHIFDRAFCPRRKGRASVQYPDQPGDRHLPDSLPLHVWVGNQIRGGQEISQTGARSWRSQECPGRWDRRLSGNCGLDIASTGTRRRRGRPSQLLSHGHYLSGYQFDHRNRPVPLRKKETQQVIFTVRGEVLSLAACHRFGTEFVISMCQV